MYVLTCIFESQKATNFMPFEKTSKSKSEKFPKKMFNLEEKGKPYSDLDMMVTKSGCLIVRVQCTRRIHNY